MCDGANISCLGCCLARRLADEVGKCACRQLLTGKFAPLFVLHSNETAESSIPSIDCNSQQQWASKGGELVNHLNCRLWFPSFYKIKLALRACCFVRAWSKRRTVQRVLLHYQSRTCLPASLHVCLFSGSLNDWLTVVRVARSSAFSL